MEIYITKINVDDIERKKKQYFFFAYLLRISICKDWYVVQVVLGHGMNVIQLLDLSHSCHKRLIRKQIHIRSSHWAL